MLVYINYQSSALKYFLILLYDKTINLHIVDKNRDKSDVR